MVHTTTLHLYDTFWMGCVIHICSFILIALTQTTLACLCDPFVAYISLFRACMSFTGTHMKQMLVVCHKRCLHKRRPLHEPLLYMIDYISYEHFCFQNDAIYESLAIHERNVYVQPNYGSNEPFCFYTSQKDLF